MRELEKAEPSRPVVLTIHSAVTKQPYKPHCWDEPWESPKAWGGFKAILAPLMSCVGLAHCWALSNASIKTSHGCLWHTNWKQHVDPHQHHSSLWHLEISQNLLSRGSSEPQTCLEVIKKVLVWASVWIHKHFLSPTLSRHETPPIWWEKVDSWTDQFNMAEGQSGALRAQRRAIIPRRGLEEVTSDLRLLKIHLKNKIYRYTCFIF